MKKQTKKLGRPFKDGKSPKTKIIRFLVTEQEKKIFDSRKYRLLEYSPTLSSSEILRTVIKNIDDKALIMFLLLDRNDSIRIKLMQDFEMYFMDK